MNSEWILRGIQVLLLGLIVYLGAMIVRSARKQKVDAKKRFFTGFWIGYVTDLLDTIGIGTFATSTTLFKATKLVDDDKKIPATLTTAHVIPVLVEALCFITIVKVEMLTLVLMAVASFFGAFVGARLTKHWNTRLIQRVLGTLLILAALIMVFRLSTDPGAHNSESVRGLHGIWLLVGVVFDFVIGMLMTMGLGNYAPELIFFSLMGIHPSVALPVMMLDASMIMTAGSREFIQSDRVNWKGMFGIIIGGVLGVLTAATFLSHIDASILKILVVFIALFTGIMLLRSSIVPTVKKKD